MGLMYTPTGNDGSMVLRLILEIITIHLLFSGQSRGQDIVQDKCHWDASKPFAENIYCLRNREKRRTGTDYDVYGHPCTSYTRLVQPERRVGYRIDGLTDSALCDRTLKRRWYRFDGPGGGVMPESCVEEYNCGTHSPIWLNGHHPTFYGENLDISVCASLTGDCCARRWYIRVANCGDYFTYLLTNTPGCFMSYCAGTQEPCPPGQSSITGFSPGCSEDFPGLIGDVDLYVGEEGHRVAVYCDYSGAMPIGVTLETEWFVQGDNSGSGDDGELPVFVDSMRGRRRSTLQEGHWAGKMGSTIYCRMRARWLNNTGVPSPYKESEKYFAGIKISKRVVEVDEASQAAVIQVQSTMPVTCLPQFAETCKLILELAHDPEMGGKQCVDGKMEQVVFGDCNVEITPSNWRDVHNVTVKAVRDFYNDGTKNMRINFKPVYSTMNSGLWNDYELPEVEVVAKDVRNGLCSSTGDPHYNTFDGFYYHVYLEGEFVLYKNTRIPIQINTRLEECGKLVTCNCGVAVKAGDDVIVIDRCMRRKRNLAYGSSFPEGWRSLHRHALEQGDEFVEGLKIYEYENGRRYTVHLPTGAYLDFRVGEDWVNIYFHASSDDWRSTLGLCGTFDEDPNNELLYPDGVTLAYARPYDACGESEEVCNFAEAWRVNKSESFFGPLVEVPLEDYEFFSDQRYCKCEKSGSGESTVLCNYHYDVHNCQAEETKRKGVDKTNDVIFKSSFRVRRDVRPSVRSDNDDIFDYFEAEFLYNETFRGQVPEWPTPQGITETYARRYCYDVIARSQASRVCNELSDSKMKTTIDECMTDIKVTDSLSWAVSSLASFTEECRNTIHQTAEYWEKGPDGNTIDNTQENGYESSQGAELLSEVCPGDCSKHGACYEGGCHCQYGYEGDDCSSSVFQQPQIHHVSDDGFCDTSIRPCRAIILHGSGFRNVSDLQCHFTDVHDDLVTTIARFITFEEISCPTPLPLMVGGESVHPALSAYTLAVTGDGFRTDDRTVVVYDSRCYACDVTQASDSCQRQTDSCIVDSVCYGSGDKDPTDCCRQCDPAVTQDAFIQVDVGRSLILYPRQTSHIVHSGSAWKLSVRAFGGSGCPFVYTTSEPEDLLLEYTPGARGLTARLLSAPVGDYAINITASDPCGTSLSRTYQLTIQPDPSPISIQNCTDNKGPYFTEKILIFNLTVGETLNTPITAQDDDDTNLEYYVIKNTNSYVSITKDGMFSYHANQGTRSDLLQIMTLDHCKETALATVVIEITECLCANGGTCVPREGSRVGAGLYNCACPAKYTGDNCQYIIN